jgi:hypothetical protein
MDRYCDSHCGRDWHHRDASARADNQQNTAGPDVAAPNSGDPIYRLFIMAVVDPLAATMAANRQFDLIAVALITIACIGIESRNRGTDLLAERRAEVCPENESTPYSWECFELIAGVSDFRWPEAPANSISTTPPHGRAGRPFGSPCPGNNENVPYTPGCIKFLSGWFWHPNSIE